MDPSLALLAAPQLAAALALALYGRTQRGFFARRELGRRLRRFTDAVGRQRLPHESR